MNLALPVKLRADFDRLPARSQAVARWMIDHPADVALLTTREQARRAGVSPATMTRLAQRFGFKGYDDVRKLYADAMRGRPESFRGRAQELVSRRADEGDAALVQDIFASLVPHLQALSSPAAVKRLTSAADLIAKAKRVFCLGLRSTFSVVYIFHYVRSLFGAASVLVDGAGDTGIDVLRTIGRGDVLLVVTVRPYTQHTLKAVRYAKEKGARIVAVTDSELSPLAPFADEILIVDTETPSFFHSMTPAFAAIECLTALIAARRGRETLKALAQSEEQLSAFGTYILPPKKSRAKT
jgi:DNA-binding MurR/RpiR family transcriptional regulator